MSVEPARSAAASVPRIWPSVSEKSPRSTRDEGDERGDDEDRRRADPEDPAEPDPRHAFAAAFVLLATAFFTMKRSMCSRASSSRICFGGDFMR